MVEKYFGSNGYLYNTDVVLTVIPKCKKNAIREIVSRVALYVFDGGMRQLKLFNVFTLLHH